jgi:DNA-binding NtrC family response regulator
MAIYSQSPSASQAFLPAHRSSANILVAEDPFVGRFLRAILQKHSHKVVTVEAVRARDWLQHEVAPDIVITNRPEAFLEFAATLPVLYTAANPDYQLAAQFPMCRVLHKPFRNEELLEAVERLAGSVVT